MMIPKHKVTISLSTTDFDFLSQKAKEKGMELRELIESLLQGYIFSSKTLPKIGVLTKTFLNKIRENIKPKQVQEAI